MGVWEWGGEEAMTNIPGIDSRDGRSKAGQKPRRCVFARLWVCVCYLISPLPIPWMQSSGKGWSGRLFVSVYIYVWEK